MVRHQLVRGVIGQVGDAAGADAAGVGVVAGRRVVAGRAVDAHAGELVHQPRVGEFLQRVVHRREAQPGHPLAAHLVQLVRGRVTRGVTQRLVNELPLTRTAQPA